jgi:KDO2-lipid IV(A) lauroyltransferase
VPFVLKIQLILADILTWPLAWLPTWLGLAFGAAGGRLAFHLSAKRRRIALGNMEMIQANGSLPPGMNAGATAREAFANLGRSAWEAICFYHRGLAPFAGRIAIEEGREAFEAALAEARQSGRGLLLVTGHMGNWELMCQYLAAEFGQKLTVVGRTSGKPLADALTERFRTKSGNAFISKKDGARDMIRVLKSGGLLGTMIDQATIGDHAGAFIPFMGRGATTNLGPLRLARRGGAAIVLMLSRREGRRHYLKILPPLPPPARLEGEDALTADAARLNEWLGDYIQQYPDQWMWGHRRWKTRKKVRENPESII